MLSRPLVWVTLLKDTEHKNVTCVRTEFYLPYIVHNVFMWSG